MAGEGRPGSSALPASPIGDPGVAAGRRSAAVDRAHHAGGAAARPQPGSRGDRRARHAALSPLTQYLHGVGQIDHHFAEYIFVLATIACGLRWFARPEDTQAAIVAGRRAGCRAGDSQRPVHPAGAGARERCSCCGCRTSRIPMRATLAFAGCAAADDAGDTDSVAAVPARAVRVLHAVVVSSVHRSGNRC